MDLSATGKRFDGVGAVSAGGTSRLLIDYPEKERSELLDLLFLPGRGASLQSLKVEIGGDTFTGGGTEASHQRSADEPPPTTAAEARGYELWLAAEARKRNPDIALLGLSWGFPAWVGAGADGAAPTDAGLNENQVSYTLAWLAQAKALYGLDVDWLGVVNERAWTTDYVKKLRASLDASAFSSVRLVAADNFGTSGPQLYQQMKHDSGFLHSLAAVGIHYPDSSTSYGPLSELRIPLWSSEDYSTNDLAGAGCLARILNWNYVVGNFSSTLIWSPVNAWLEDLRWVGDGLLDAYKPWAGHYDVRLPLWVAAHTTHFVSTGWRLLPQGRGAGMLPDGGSFVTYVDPDTGDWTIVVEMMAYNDSLCVRSNPDPYEVVDRQRVQFELGSRAAGSLVRAFETNVSSRGGALARLSDLTVDQSGNLAVTISRNTLVTLTSAAPRLARRWQRRVPSEARAQHPFPLPYRDDFEHPGIGGLPRYFSDQCGSWAVRSCPDGSSRCLTQEVRSSPSENHTGWWDQDSPQPLTIIGDRVGDVSAQVDVVLPASMPRTLNHSIAVRTGGTLSAEGCGTDTESRWERRCVEAYASTWYEFGYFLRLSIVAGPSSESPVVLWAFQAGPRTLIAGRLRWEALGPRFTLRLESQGSSFKGYVSGDRLFEAEDDSWQMGWVALGSGWHTAAFDAFEMQPSTADAITVSI